MTAAANTGAGGSFESDAVGVSTSFERVMEGGGEPAIGDTTGIGGGGADGSSTSTSSSLPSEGGGGGGRRGSGDGGGDGGGGGDGRGNGGCSQLRSGNDSSTASIPLPQLEHQA